jgi:Tfp pilus assembly protein PilF
MNKNLDLKLLPIVSSLLLLCQIPSGGCLAIDLNNQLPSNGDRSKILLQQGIDRLNRGEDLAAIQNFNRAIEINPKSAAAYYYRGLAAAHRSRNYLNCDRYQPPATSSHPQPEEIVNCLEPLLTECSARLSNPPDTQRLQVFCDRIYLYEWIRHRQQQAIDNFNLAIQYQPQYPQAYYQRGLIYLESDRLNLAQVDLAKAMNIYLALAKQDLHPTNSHLTTATSQIDRAIEISQLIDRISLQNKPKSNTGYSSLVPLQRQKVQHLYQVANRLLKQGNIRSAIVKYQEAKLILLNNRQEKSTEFQEIARIIEQLTGSISRK